MQLSLLRFEPCEVRHLTCSFARISEYPLVIKWQQRVSDSAVVWRSLSISAIHLILNRLESERDLPGINQYMGWFIIETTLATFCLRQVKVP